MIRHSLSGVINEAVDPVITVSEMRDHLNFTEAASEVDDLLAFWISVWEERIEDLTGRPPRETTYTYKLDTWKQEIELPRGPVTSVTSVKYLHSSTGVLTTLVNGTDYEVDLDSEIARIRPLPGKYWPQLYDRYLPIEIVFVAGYGGDGGLVLPDKLKQLIKLEVAACFKYRSSLTEGKPVPIFFSRAVLTEAALKRIC